MGYQTGVVEALRDHELDVRTVPGWERRGSSSFNPRGHVVHHDAIPTRWQTPPAILIDGRSDLPGPLCNFALNTYGTVYVVAAGRANHAGSGSWRGLVGNSSVWGTEAQNAGTGQVWPDEQIQAYVRLCAATADFSGFTAEMVCRHAEWTSRKIDPAGPWADGHDWSRDASHFRALVANGGSQTTGGFGTMTDAEIDAKFLKLAVDLQEVTRKLDAVSEETKGLHKRTSLTRRIVRTVADKVGVTQSEIDSQA